MTIRCDRRNNHNKAEDTGQRREEIARVHYNNPKGRNYGVSFFGSQLAFLSPRLNWLALPLGDYKLRPQGRRSGLTWRETEPADRLSGGQSREVKRAGPIAIPERLEKEFGLVVAVLVGLQVFILVREANAAGVNCSYKTLLSAMPRHWLRTSRP